MTLHEFTRYAESWGADIARWPEGMRAEGARLAASPEAEIILTHQRALDAMLREAPRAVAPARVDRAINRVVTVLAAEKPRGRFTGALSRWLIPTAGLACAVGIGALAATVGPLADTSPDDAHGVLTMIFDMTSVGQGFVL
ncbi:MAG TPA: hypothetical protein VK438_03065 [Xanthobacteraceae bacterium]|nr:hypothetical protein [Xanthobacteraceae bacterium]